MYSSSHKKINAWFCLLVFIAIAALSPLAGCRTGFFNNEDSPSQTSSEAAATTQTGPSTATSAETPKSRAIPKPEGNIEVVYDDANVKADYIVSEQLRGFFVSGEYANFHSVDRECIKEHKDSIYCQNEYSMNLGSGDQKLLYSTSGDFMENVAYSDSRAFILVEQKGNGQKSTSLLAIDNRTGQEAWRQEVQGGRSLEFAGGTLFSFEENGGAGSAGTFTAFDPQTGQVKWLLNHGGTLNREGVTGGTAYIVAGMSSSNYGPSAVYAVDVANGNEKWKFSNGGYFTGYAVGNGMVFTAGTDKKPASSKETAIPVVHGVDAATGQDKWAFTSVDATQPPQQGVTEKLRIVGATPDTVIVVRSVVHGGVRDDLFIGTVDESLYGIDAITGKQKWVTDVIAGSTDPMAASYILEDGIVYAARNNKTINWDQDIGCVEMGQDCPDGFPVQLDVRAIEGDLGSEVWKITTQELKSEVPNQLYLLTAAEGGLYLTDMPHQPSTTMGKSDMGFIFRLR
ncbi:MAG: PQQ-like beta-propeller repeat protein [Thermoleophilia bacterium]|nr:PQQ-like beta-propeller repeat protein [Thermoleophilia bacterium]